MYKCPLSSSKENSFVHVSWPVWADLKVAALPIKMSALRARDSRTLRRSGLERKPMSLSGLLLTKEATTMSLSWPW